MSDIMITVKTMRTFFCIMAMALGLSAFSAQSGVKKELKVNRLFADHMVLQRESAVDFWGECSYGQKLTISASWGKNASTIADSYGKWKVKLATPKAGGPYTLKISTVDKTITINDVLIGEVWLASGQSNMDISVSGWLPNDTIFNSKKEIADANFPNIRLLKVPSNTSISPMDSVGKCVWTPVSPQTVGPFSATAFFYARKLYQELHVPIGIIQSALGGTVVEAWTSRQSIKKLGDFNSTIEVLEKLESKINVYYDKSPFRVVPRTDEDWKNLHLNDAAALKPSFDDSQWEATKLPGRFDKISSGEFDGVMLLRKTFEVIDPSVDYVLRIGSVDDMDQTYVNGVYVGGLIGSGLATTSREMVVPSSLLVKGTNTIAIRAIDTGGPGFVNGPISLTSSNGDVISLAGNWKSRLVAENVSGKFYTYDLQTNLLERPNMSQLTDRSPSVLFNAMINPLVPYTIKGVIWYQGESNVGKADKYKQLFPLMIQDWRARWGCELPFYYVQIAPYLYESADQKNQSQKLRDAQRYALKLPKTGMAVTLDIGKLSSAHPAFKQDVGNRLARFALANEYGKKQVTQGPLFKKAVAKGSNIEVFFESKSIGTGLLASANGLTGFEVAGADKVYVAAEAQIVGGKIIVGNSSVQQPLYVRYAWSDGFSATLFNKEGLPASTFTSEE
jgi:sialate O-acetylesterase